MGLFFPSLMHFSFFISTFLLTYSSLILLPINPAFHLKSSITFIFSLKLFENFDPPKASSLFCQSHIYPHNIQPTIPQESMSYINASSFPPEYVSFFEFFRHQVPSPSLQRTPLHPQIEEFFLPAALSYSCSLFFR